LEEWKREIEYGVIRRKSEEDEKGERTVKKEEIKEKVRRAGKGIYKVNSRSSSHFGHAFCAAAANYLIISDHW